MKKAFLSMAFAMVCVAPAFAATAQAAKPAEPKTEPKKEMGQDEKAGAMKPSLLFAAATSCTCDQKDKDAKAMDKTAPEKTPAKPTAPKLAFA